MQQPPQQLYGIIEMIDGRSGETFIDAYAYTTEVLAKEALVEQFDAIRTTIAENGYEIESEHIEENGGYIRDTRENHYALEIKPINIIR